MNPREALGIYYQLIEMAMSQGLFKRIQDFEAAKASHQVLTAAVMEAENKKGDGKSA